jgi:tetratricopeptide (TPR) repeat protein
MKTKAPPKFLPLPPEIAEPYAAVQKMGGEFRVNGDMVRAEECFLQAWALLPEPKSGWSESMSKATGLAIFFLNTSQREKARAWIPNVIAVDPDNFFGFVHLLVGRIHYECGNKEEAIRWFQNVYDTHGRTAFREENRKYLDLIQVKKSERTKPAAGPKPDEWPVMPDPDAFKLMAGPIALPDAMHDQIKQLCAEGDQLVEADDFDPAIAKYREALFLLPRPIEKWEAATWIYIALGDAMFLKGDFLAAAKPLRDVMFCPGAEQNPFIRLRRGQVAFEKGNLPVAETELGEAYRREGKSIFSEDDPKYWEFIKDKLNLAG